MLCGTFFWSCSGYWLHLRRLLSSTTSRLHMLIMAEKTLVLISTNCYCWCFSWSYSCLTSLVLLWRYMRGDFKPNMMQLSSSIVSSMRLVLGLIIYKLVLSPHCKSNIQRSNHDIAVDCEDIHCHCYDCFSETFHCIC
jgi:hypothetical protein